MATTPVEAVAEILIGAAFRRLPRPLQIAGVTIDVAGAFVGSDKSPDLVLVGDTVQTLPARLLSTIEGAGRALDLVASRRPLTLVVVGPRPDSAALREMSRFARILPVGEAADEASLRNWLAVLLPLRLPLIHVAHGEAANTDLAARASDSLARELVLVALKGADEVAATLYAAVEAPFATPETSEAEPDA